MIKLDHPASAYMGTDICSLSATEIALAVREGHLKPRTVVHAFLERIHQANPSVNAVLDECLELIEQDLQSLEQALAAGTHLPLAGVPVTVKDVIWVKGRSVTQGSLLYKDFVAPTDAIAVQRLKAAGAIVIGMTNSSEFACKGLTTNKLYGVTRHPRNVALTPGGSSGGSAAAVAAHFSPLSLATDAGGSCRRPAAHVGVVGFKPTFGAIPDGPGFAAVVPGIQCVAPMARTVGDVSLAFSVMAGADAHDPRSAVLLSDKSKPIRDVKVAYSPTVGVDIPIDLEVRLAIEKAIARIRDQHVCVATADPPWPDNASEAALMPLQHTGLAYLYGERWRNSAASFDPDIGQQIARGLQYQGIEVVRARAISSDIADRLADFFTHYDFLITPTTPCVSWSLRDLGPTHINGQAVEPRSHAAFTPFFNHAGVPAISIPCGTNSENLPIGLQIVGRVGADRQVLEFAQWLEVLLEDMNKPFELSLK